ARAVAALREHLRRVVIAGQLDSLALPHALGAIYVWDKIFTNPLSVANLIVPSAPLGDTDPIARALVEPIPPRVADAGALVAAQPPPRRARGGKLRIGYVSSHFRRHAVTSYMANRVLCRDRDRFEVLLFAVGGKHDDVARELAASADGFFPFDPYPLDRVAQAIVAADLDLVIHCDIGMDLATHLLAGLHLAPRQIALMGHATTTGMPTI